MPHHNAVMTHRRNLLLATLGGLALPAWSQKTAPQAGAVTDTTWTDATRQRALPVKVRWPAMALDAATPPASVPVVIFSHGLGGTRDGGDVWGKAWAAAGFVVVHLQHPGSDIDAVRAVTGSFRDQPALRSVAGPAQLLARLRDVSFALDEIARLQATGVGRWAMVRPTQMGMSGHSFGAHTTLGMAGQRYPGFDGIGEPRLASFIAFSPTLPALGDPRRAFERLTMPVLSITGTRDDDVVGVGATPDRRIGVFAALPPGSKAHLVLKDADHMTFAGQTGRAAEIVPREAVTRELQAAQHALVAAITTDWWRATLMQDAAAMARLQAPAGLLAGDVWERK